VIDRESLSQVATASPAIEVHIGTIDVAAPPVPAPPRRRAAVTGFADYRAVRRGGGWSDR
jgi:hypothetical protein